MDFQEPEEYWKMGAIMKTMSVFLLIVVLLSACNPVDTNIRSTSTPESSRSVPFPMITDVNRYSEVLNSMDKDSPLLAHFPKEIPPEASNVRFAYQPRIMQGAMILELLVTLLESQIDELWSQYSSLEQYQFTEDKTLDDIPEPILFLIRDANYELNRDFSIFFIDAQPAGKEEFIWNHGTMYGVGINKSDLEVIYWLQYW
ncbi:MAG: hypothetical protein JW963_19580 [Anaerolineales bacterium]|nr:hypothetical protein [Anaerolineales bacterium]